MEQVFFEVDGDHFSVEFTADQNTVNGIVYPIQPFTDQLSNKEDWGYFGKHNNDGFHKEKDSNTRILFEFTFQWRGIWDGRIWFKEGEYYSEQLKTISDLWDKIEQHLIDIAKAK